MDCKKVESLLTKRILNELDARANAELSTHLEGCPKCSQLLNELSATVKIVLDAAKLEPKPVLSAERRASLLEVGKAGREGGRRSMLRPIPVWGGITAVAAALMLFVLAGVIMPRMREHSPLDGLRKMDNRASEATEQKDAVQPVRVDKPAARIQKAAEKSEESQTARKDKAAEPGVPEAFGMAAGRERTGEAPPQPKPALAMTDMGRARKFVPETKKKAKGSDALEEENVEAGKVMKKSVPQKAEYTAVAKKAQMDGAVAGKAAPGEKKQEQGITGIVVKLKGNFMPGPGTKGGERTPLSVPVHIFKGKVKIFEKPDPKHEALVKIVQSDKDGKFLCELARGEYTIVAEIGGKLHLNLFTFDGKNRCWGTVKVEKGKWTTVKIEETSEAAF